MFGSRRNFPSSFPRKIEYCTGPFSEPLKLKYIYVFYQLNSESRITAKVMIIELGEADSLIVIL